MLPPGTFVANDTFLDNNENQIIILTGPNMAGKSTYMRQVALIVIMAQMGSFVPAKEARIGVVDRVFTRIGAADDLASGQSTFMVEMVETANILHNATDRSLIILDEVGRGTSTFDGMSIAWAVIEYIHDKKPGAKTLFATHYYQLTELASKMTRIKNYHIPVKEEGDELVFVRKVVPGSVDKSYGIQVANLAGLPHEVITRAKEILAEVEKTGGKIKEIPRKKRYTQLVLFQNVYQEHPVIKELKKLDINNITPIEALNLLYRFKMQVKEKEVTYGEDHHTSR